MPKRRYFTPTADEIAELEKVRDHHRKPYMREKAGALVKIALGQTPRAVALHGLLKPRKPDTIYAWLDTYESEGLKGLCVKKGRGRKPAYSPAHEKSEDAKEAVLSVIRRTPSDFGYSCSRWSLQMLLESCDWLSLKSESGLSQLLKRLGISYKRGRDYVHSPDRNYDAKLTLIELMRLRAYYAPERYAFLYLDELTYYRQPTLARAYESVGKNQALARRSHCSNNSFRVLAALDALSGQVHYLQRSKTNIACFTQFWYLLHEKYPDKETIYVVVDNWPVHYHADVLAPLIAQNFPFPPKLPANWSTTPSRKAKIDTLPIQLLALPTYASWLNPIEKLWRWLKQDILHLHRLSNAWTELRQLVAQFLETFSSSSKQLLQYTGLLPV